MAFYLLAFVIALAIFGIIRSPNARERLHLQSIYNRGSEIILKQMRVYRQQLFAYLGLNNGNIDILEINGDVDDEPEIEEILRSDSIEEIQGIRLRSDYRIISEGGETVLAPNGSEAIGSPEPEEDDNVLEAITASLRRLSSAASSGAMSGSQLYDILVQETLLHDKSRRNEAPRASGAVAATAPRSAPTKEALQPTQRPAEAAAAAQKTRMYFGQSPLEYKPHQK